MRFQMIFEGVDRASKIMNKLMAAEKKTAKAMQAGSKATTTASAGSTKASEKLASALTKIGSAGRAAYRAVAAGANHAGNATVALHKKTVALAKSGLGQVASGAGKTMRGLTLAAGVATLAFGSSAMAAGQLLDTAKSFESYRIQLETLEGSAAKGQKAMAWITEFAVKTPLELDQVVESYRNLKTFGLDPTNGTLMSLVDTMAASGKGVEQLEGLTLALGQAWTKEKLQGEEALQLLERGVPVWDILSKKYGKNAAALQEMASKGQLGREAIQFLIDEIGRRNAGASEKMSRTWEGMIGNLMDTWLQFKLAIMDAGLFEWMKDKLQLVLNTVNKMADDGTFGQWAEYISNRIVLVLDTAWTFATRLYEIFARLGEYLSIAADYVGGWERLAAILAGMAFAPILISTAAGIVQIAMGLTMLSAALLANPIALAITAIIAGAVLIYTNWEPIKAFFLDLWTSISNAASAAWTAVKTAVISAVEAIPGLVTGAWETVKSVLAWHPAIIIIQNWGQITAAVSDAVNSAFAAVNTVWESIKAVFDWSPVESIQKAWAGISDAVGGMIDGAAARAGAAWDKVKSVFTFGGDETASELDIPVLPDAATLRADADAALAKLAELDAAAAKIVPEVVGAVQQAQQVLASISFYDQGAALMETMAAGMRARAMIVVNEIQRMAQMVRDHLPSSPAKVGPLSDIHRLKFGETIASSIRSEPMVKAMRAATAATMAAAAISTPSVAAASTGADAARAQVAKVSTQSTGASSGAPNAQGRQPLVYSPTVVLKGGSESDKQEFAKLLREHSREIARMMEEEDRRKSRTST